MARIAWLSAYGYAMGTYVAVCLYVLQVPFYKFCFTSFVLQVSFYKFCFASFVLQVSFDKFRFVSFV